jgi:hypothetical protein
MDQTLKDEWTAALRSGNYKQGAGALKNKNDEYCCLGVLCDISGEGEWVPVMKQCAYRDKQEDNITHPGTTWSGLSLVQMNQLIYFNDDKEWTFQQIADWIEENL